MTEINFRAIRRGLASLDASASHAASGDTRPKVEEIFAPEQHAGALDPNVTIVLGARGAGKSFWAGVLGNDETRKVASDAFPNLGLANLSVKFGFTGIAGDGSVSKATIDNHVPLGEEPNKALRLWRCVLLRALTSTVNPKEKAPTISALMQKYTDPEEWEQDCENADQKLAQKRRKVLIIFDALDGLAVEWERLRRLIDALLEASWSTRGYRALRVKLFLRPDQLKDLGLRFVELPKLQAGATNLRWSGTDLYGMLFARLGTAQDEAVQKLFAKFLESQGVAAAPSQLKKLKNWPLAYDRKVQARVFTHLAGAYMGRGHKKGRTYDWPINHLADGHGEVTPRSFLTLMIAAAKVQQAPPGQAISAEGIRHGLREASKARVNQLELEFPWIKRVIAPLARMQVPCTAAIIRERWQESETLEAIMRRAAKGEFLPPIDPKTEEKLDDELIQTLVRIGILTVRTDGRFDMPDLFRVAARLLKKGGVAPT